MYGMIGLGVFMLLLIIKILLRYEPKFDLVVSNNRFILLLWYNRYDDNNIKKRVYIKLF
jgi:hypothetical protein